LIIQRVSKNDSVCSGFAQRLGERSVASNPSVVFEIGGALHRHGFEQHRAEAQPLGLRRSAMSNIRGIRLEPMIHDDSAHLDTQSLGFMGERPGEGERITAAAEPHEKEGSARHRLQASGPFPGGPADICHGRGQPGSPSRACSLGHPVRLLHETFS
jgi:hypothetical protein